MKPFMIATALAMLATPAYASGAKIDKECINEERKEGSTLAQAKYICSKQGCMDEIMKEPWFYPLADAKTFCRIDWKTRKHMCDTDQCKD